MKKLVSSLFFLTCIGAALSTAATVEVGRPMPKLSNLVPGAKVPNTSGKIILIDFWASWCGPCRKSFPILNELHRKYGPRGLVIIGISVDEKEADYRKFASKMKASFPLIHDSAHKAAAAFNLPAMPMSYIVDSKGIVRYIHKGFSGARTRAKYIAEIETLLTKER